MKFPVFVFIPADTPQETDYSGTWKRNGIADWRLTALGLLEGHSISGQSDLEALGRDFPQAKAAWVTQQIKSEDGTVACQLCAGLMVTTLEEAKALRSYVPLGHQIGPEKLVAP